MSDVQALIEEARRWVMHQWATVPVMDKDATDLVKSLADALEVESPRVRELEAAQQGEWEYGSPYETPEGERVQPFKSEDAARIYGCVEPVRRRVFPWEPVPDPNRRDRSVSVREALAGLDGSNAAVVSAMTGLSRDELDDLGGVPDTNQGGNE